MSDTNLVAVWAYEIALTPTLFKPLAILAVGGANLSPDEAIPDHACGNGIGL